MRKCLECPNEFEIPTAPTRKERKKFCSKRCADIGNAKLSAKKRGDVQRDRGEKKTYRKLNGRHEHRVIMEQKLGRPLTSKEIVHHIDGNRRNNSIENLELTTQSEHAKHHSTKYPSSCKVDFCDGKHKSGGYCVKHYYQVKRHGKIYVQTSYVKRVASRGQERLLTRVG